MKELFSIYKFSNEENDEIFLQDEFSDVIIMYDRDYTKIKRILALAQKRKIYLIPLNYEKAIAILEVPEIKRYGKNIIIFQNINECQKYFHINTEQYIPKLIFAEHKEEAEHIRNILQQEHEYRVTDKGRNNKHVLLTIGIPTHNRGNLLLKRIANLKNMPYDAEIEVIIAKNGNALYQDEYRSACKELDSRFIYYGVDEELKPHQNWYNVIRYSHGQYVLFVSDEDDVVIDALDHYLKLLSDNPKVGLVIAKTSIERACIKNSYGEKGLDAFQKIFLMQNYLSGLIVNRQIIINANVMKYEKYNNNAFYRNYPHEWWCAELSRTGDCITDATLLIEESDQVLEEECENYEKLGVIKKSEAFEINSGLPQYATYEARFEQFQGQIEFLSLFMGDNSAGIKIGLIMAIKKLAYLLNLARSHSYKKEKYLDIIDEYAHLTMEAMDYFKFNNNDQGEILIIISQLCGWLILNNEKMN